MNCTNKTLNPAKPVLYYFFDWWNVSDFMFRRFVREFVDAGADHFVLSEYLLRSMLKDPERVKFLQEVCKDMGVCFGAAHAPCDGQFDLNIVEPERRPDMLREQIQCMKYAREFGTKTYTIHVGAYHHYVYNTPLQTLRKLANESLEILVPEAEKLGLVLAVENCFEPPNTPDEVNGLIKPFLGSPAIGTCFDTGHFNMIRSAPWKDDAKYPEYVRHAWRNTGVIHEEHTLEKFHDTVVTCHIHDNDGYCDLHGMPFDGVISWKKQMEDLFACPKMVEFQTEVTFDYGTNWAGQTLAPVGGYSIRQLVETFRKLGF